MSINLQKKSIYKKKKKEYFKIRNNTWKRCEKTKIKEKDERSGRWSNNNNNDDKQKPKREETTAILFWGFASFPYL